MKTLTIQDAKWNRTHQERLNNLLPERLSWLGFVLNVLRMEPPKPSKLGALHCLQMSLCCEQDWAA